jgi:hypothetical protein
VLAGKERYAPSPEKVNTPLNEFTFARKPPDPVAPGSVKIPLLVTAIGKSPPEKVTTSITVVLPADIAD